MRRLTPLVAALALLSTAAGAGTRATYAMADQDGQQLVIEAGDAGNARAGVGGSGDYVLMRGADAFVVQDKAGTLEVARIADVAAAMDQVMPPLFKSLFSAAAGGNGAKLVITKGGTQTVAGYPGTVYTVAGLDQEHPAAAQTFVVSSDATLAPVGRAFAQFLESTFVLLSGLIGQASADMIAQERQLAALGTPLRGGDKATLLKVETGVAIDPQRFALPGEPRSVPALVAEFKASMKPTP